jgi:hypothetical protein
MSAFADETRDDQGLIVRDTRYYGQRADPPEWRSQWVERLQPPLD